MRVGRPLLCLVLLAGFAIPMSATAAGPQDRAELLIRGAAVIPMGGPGILMDHSVLVVAGRIDDIAPAGELDRRAGATVVDAEGRFLLPGLADMHVHLAEADLARLLARGVTTAREMSGSDRHLTWRDEIGAGERLGPRLLVASPLIAGEPAPSPRHELLDSPAAALDRVRADAAKGYDLLNVDDGLAGDTYDALVREARAQGLPVAGEVPGDVGLGGTLHARQELEHVESLVDAARGPLDATTLPFLATHFRDAGVWVTPTLASGRASATTATGAQLTLALLRAGVPLLAGSGAAGPATASGISLVEELQALVSAGFTRREALELATTNAGRYLREVLERPEITGVIRPGAVGDLVLLDGDPLQDLEALCRPWGVVAGGRWLDRERLAAMLDDAEGRRPAHVGSTGGREPGEAR